MEKIKIATMLTDDEAKMELEKISKRIEDNEKVRKTTAANHGNSNLEITILTTSFMDDDECESKTWHNVLQSDIVNFINNEILDDCESYDLIDSYVLLPDKDGRYNKMTLFKFIFISIQTGIEFGYNGSVIGTDELIEMAMDSYAFDDDYNVSISEELESI